jgi:hypothetical protein
MPRDYRASGSDFQIWLDQPIWVTDNTKLTRREIYPAVAEELTEWLKSKGYTMSNRWGKGHKILAQWSYAQACDFIRENKKGIVYPSPSHRNTLEDYDQFHHICGFFDFQDLFEKWRMIEDFDPELPFGNILLHNIADLAYCFVDLDLSKQGRRIAQIGEDSESDSDGSRTRKKKKRHEDVYLVEARQGMHGGKGWKV